MESLLKKRCERKILSYDSCYSFVGITIQPTISHIAVFILLPDMTRAFSLYGISLRSNDDCFKPVYGFIVDKFGLMISTFCTYFLMILGF